MQVVILRGLPGSGKSTWATKQPNSVICSADAAHMVDGKYQFIAANAGKAHTKCLDMYLTYLSMSKYDASKDLTVIVDNTNCSAMEVAPYARLAEVFGLPFKIVYFPIGVDEAVKRGVHSVPLSTILAMQSRLLTDPLPPYWPQELAP